MSLRLLLVTVLAVLAVTAVPLRAAGEPALPDSLQPVMVPFGLGEKLDFKISFGPVDAGEASLEVKGLSEQDGRICYHLESTARSNRVFSTIYRVRDKVTSMIDVESLVTRYFAKRLREGDYRKRVRMRFDQQNLKVHYGDGGVFDIMPESHDILAAFYIVRTLPLLTDQSTHIKTHSTEKNYDLEVIVHGRETIEVPAGRFECLKVEPIVQGEGLFQFEGDIVIWLTDDERRLPVLMKTNIKIGAVDAALTGYVLGEPLVAEVGP